MLLLGGQARASDPSPALGRLELSGDVGGAYPAPWSGGYDRQGLGVSLGGGLFVRPAGFLLTGIVGDHVIVPWTTDIGSEATVSSTTLAAEARAYPYLSGGLLPFAYLGPGWTFVSPSVSSRRSEIDGGFTLRFGLGTDFRIGSQTRLGVSVGGNWVLNATAESCCSSASDPGVPRGAGNALGLRLGIRQGLF